MTDGRARLIVTHDTILKRSTAQSRQILNPLDLHPCLTGAEFAIASWLEENGHIRFSLHEQVINNYNTWYCWKPHCELKTANPEITALSFAKKPGDRGQSLQLPGLSQCIFLNDPICSDSPNFYWYEALHGGERIPPDGTVTAGIIKLAKAAQKVRDRIGRSLHITSWYRDPDTNWRVGGASASRHLWGDAIDFWVEGMSGNELYHALDPWWEGGLGRYSNLPYIVHIDARGYVSRWG